jgi:hypothetical protein
MSVLLIMVDGLGAGERDAEKNPLARGEYLLSRFADGTGAALPPGAAATLIDPTLGVPGRPQSPTGQASLYTGRNAAALLGKHLVGFPNTRLTQLIEEHSFLKSARAELLNAYHPGFLAALGLSHRPPDAPAPRLPPRARFVRLAAGGIAARAAGLTFRTYDDARRGLALPGDLTGERARSFGIAAPDFTPGESAGVLLAALARADLVLYEMFVLDECGHLREMARAEALLARLDATLREMVRGLRDTDVVVVTADHGNVEDMTTRNHTRNPVPLLAFGAGAAQVCEGARDLTHVAPALQRILAERRQPNL